MKKWLSLCLCVACLLTVLSGCGGGATISDVQKAQKSELKTVSETIRGSLKDVFNGGNRKYHKEFPTIAEPEADVGASNLKRAKDVFMAIDTADSNTLYSPVSLEMALGLLSEGSSGETRDQILQFLGTKDYSKVAEALIEHAKDVTTEESDVDDSEPFSQVDVFDGYHTALNIANSLWVRDDYTLKSDFLGVAKKSYDATAQALDFSKPDEAAETVNAWCAVHTKGLIKGILRPDVITRDLALVLCNSVYFESGWWEPWDVREGTFTTSEGTEIVLSKFLYSTEDEYYEAGNAVAFGKRYVSGATFIGILPNEGVTLKEIDLESLLESKTTEFDVHASMPKLNYEFSCEDLANILASLGVDKMLSPDAHLDGLVNESNDIYVSDVLQKCKIELDENGTKAAAVTAMMMADNAVMLEEPTPVKEVHLNRPFYYMIMDGDTVLFIGAVNTVEGTPA